MKHDVKGTYIRLVMEPVNRKLEILFSIDIVPNLLPINYLVAEKMFFINFLA